jgi:hypothetical protein
MFPCPKCNKKFSRKTHLDQHLLKIKPCDINNLVKKDQDYPKINNLHPINNNLIDQLSNLVNNVSETEIKNNLSNHCPYCNKVFFQKYNVKKHLDNNSCKKKKEVEKHELVMMNKIKEILLNNNSNNPQNITNNNTINNITNNNITNNIQVNIYSAGKEDLSRLSQEDILKICTSGTYYPIVAAEVIHCNKNYPEFQNVLISNLRSSTGLVFLNDNWISKTQDEILSKIMQIDKKHVSTLIKDLKVDNKLQIKLESTKDEVESSESKEHQKPKIKEHLYNASKMIKKNKKNLDKVILDEE